MARVNIGTAPPSEKERPRGRGRPSKAGAVPPAYPDPESWRRFGLLRRQLQYNKGVPAVTSGPARE